MNNRSKPSANGPTQGGYTPPSPGITSELAKHHYNVQIRDAWIPRPSPQRYNRTSPTSTLHKPIDTLAYIGTKRTGGHSSDFANQCVQEGALEGEGRGVEPDIQPCIGNGKLPKPAQHEIEELDELALIERAVWGDFSKPIPPVHESRSQDVTSRGSSRQRTLPKADRIQAQASIANYLLQGQ